MLSVAKVKSQEDKCNSSVLNSLKKHFVGEALNKLYELLNQFDEPDAENGWNQSADSIKTTTINNNPYIQACRF